MTDLGSTIAPKSDQLNADDLLARPLTVTITKVSARPGSQEQPIAISFTGDNGKPYLPCKSMRRVLVQTWGANGADYVGRSMTLYRDPAVLFGGVAVGGIRISHMSHIDAPVTFALTMSRASRKPYTVQPLVIAAADDLATRVARLDAALHAAKTREKAAHIWTINEPLREELRETDPERFEAICLKYDVGQAELPSSES